LSKRPKSAPQIYNFYKFSFYQTVRNIQLNKYSENWKRRVKMQNSKEAATAANQHKIGPVGMGIDSNQEQLPITNALSDNPLDPNVDSADHRQIFHPKNGSAEGTRRRGTGTGK
jgi:hypothetical protein